MHEVLSVFLKHFVSVPIRGLFNLTSNYQQVHTQEKALIVSVPIRGLFNLTKFMHEVLSVFLKHFVSVPIRGLFNLTISQCKNI